MDDTGASDVIVIHITFDLTIPNQSNGYKSTFVTVDILTN